MNQRNTAAVLAVVGLAAVGFAVLPGGADAQDAQPPRSDDVMGSIARLIDDLDGPARVAPANEPSVDDLARLTRTLDGWGTPAPRVADLDADQVPAFEAPAGWNREEPETPQAVELPSGWSAPATLTRARATEWMMPEIPSLTGGERLLERAAIEAQARLAASRARADHADPAQQWKRQQLRLARGPAGTHSSVMEVDGSAMLGNGFASTQPPAMPQPAQAGRVQTRLEPARIADQRLSSRVTTRLGPR